MATDALSAALAGNTGTTAKTAAAAAAANAAANKRTDDMSNQFLKLLVAQMQNQDPLNPMDNSQVTSQIAQINTVSGINDLNTQLQTINGQIDTSQQLQASALIGHKVLVPGSEISVGSDGTATAFGMDLPSDAAKVTLTITDDAGTVVHQSSYQNQTAGVQSFSWDGKDANNKTVGAGRYHIDVKAEDADGNAIPAKTLSTGYVDGVVAGDSGPQLDLGPNGLVSLKDVYQIV